MLYRILHYHIIVLSLFSLLSCIDQTEEEDCQNNETCEGECSQDDCLPQVPDSELIIILEENQDMELNEELSNFGEDCLSSSDCLSNLCIDIVGSAQICSDICDLSNPSSCPDTYTCSVFGNTGVCVPAAEMAGTEMAGAEMAGAEMAGAEMAGAEMAGTEMAGAEMAGTEVQMTQTSCLEITRCLNTCSDDIDCQNECITAGTLRAQTEFSNLRECVSQAARMCMDNNECITNNCLNEISVCSDGIGVASLIELSCSEYLSCLSLCFSDNECIADCNERLNDQGQLLFNRMTSCGESNNCQNLNCLQANCSSELNSCYSHETESLEICPIAIVQEEPIELNTSQIITLDGSSSLNVDRSSADLSYHWSVITRPDQSESQLVEEFSNEQFPGIGGPRDNSETALAQFYIDKVGTYVFSLTVTNLQGVSAPSESCQQREALVTVSLIPQPSLSIEVTWSIVEDSDEMNTEGPDIDIHLLHPNGNIWSQAPWDCYYGNNSPDWGEVGPLNNPSLDMDDTNGTGPETISMIEPEVMDSPYKVGVHYYSSNIRFMEENLVSIATVAVFIEGLLVGRYSREMQRVGNFWEAAKIFWTTDRRWVEETTRFYENSPWESPCNGLCEEETPYCSSQSECVACTATEGCNEGQRCHLGTHTCEPDFCVEDCNTLQATCSDLYTSIFTDEEQCTNACHVYLNTTQSEPEPEPEPESLSICLQQANCDEEMIRACFQLSDNGACQRAWDVISLCDSLYEQFLGQALNETDFIQTCQNNIIDDPVSAQEYLQCIENSNDCFATIFCSL